MSMCAEEDVYPLSEGMAQTSALAILGRRRVEFYVLEDLARIDEVIVSFDSVRMVRAERWQGPLLWCSVHYCGYCQC